MLLSSQPPQMTANEKSGQLKSATTKRKCKMIFDGQADTATNNGSGAGLANGVGRWCPSLEGVHDSSEQENKRMNERGLAIEVLSRTSSRLLCL